VTESDEAYIYPRFLHKGFALGERVAKIVMRLSK